MTYHIDLLLEEERRTARPRYAFAALVTGGVAFVAALLLAALLLFLSARSVRVQVASAQTHWDVLRPKHEALLKLRGGLQTARAASRQLDACTHARLGWGEELASLQAAVPAAVQLTELRVTQFTGLASSNSTKVVRSYDLRLSGKVGGEDAADQVRSLMTYLSSPACTGRIASVTVPAGGFRKDPARGAARTDCLFEILCRYRARSFE